MENQMFCFQCQETAFGTGCVLRGVCGKQPATAHLMDALLYALKGVGTVATALRENNVALPENAAAVIVDGLFSTITNANFDNDSISSKITAALTLKKELVALAQQNNVALPQTDVVSFDVAPADYETAGKKVGVLKEENVDLRSLKELTMYGLKGMAAYYEHASRLGHTDDDIIAFMERALATIARTDATDKELLNLVMETGQYGVKVMALLDKANTDSYGRPEVTRVNIGVGTRPGILISGHDLRDIEQLLEQTQGTGIDVYTHGEMLPAHAYPELHKYPHLKGNFGTAWQNQRKEFAGIPAPVLFTTNCLMPPLPSYRDRVFTTGVVSFPGAVHIGEEGAEALGRGKTGPHKDFTPVIEKALELGGYPEDQARTGINGGTQVTTGFGHHFVLDHAGDIVAAVKAGKIRHFFLVGGCDGAKPGRSYYTDFVKQTPADSIVLTLACGKYRFNDLDLGTVAGFPRLMDIGQCNDAYSAIRIATALAEAFGCGVNDLPLSFVLSWYEQKAVCILLTLLHLGIRNILLGPSLPAFVSPNVLQILADQYRIAPISTPEADLRKLLGKKV